MAKLLASMHVASNNWVRRVNPHWYEAREIPKTFLKAEIERKKPVFIFKKDPIHRPKKFTKARSM